jgi:hypothetical protein
MKQIYNIVLRVFATFCATGLGVIGAGTIAGVPIVQSIFMAGIGGVATVVEGLSRSFLNDGKLDAEEINAVFAKVQSGTYSSTPNGEQVQQAEVQSEEVPQS